MRLVHSRRAFARRRFVGEASMRTAFDEEHAMARAALWFAVRWVAMLALALGAATAFVGLS